MKNKFNNLLPIGSVVLLKNGQRYLTIIGTFQFNLKTGKMYDYIGVVYPEGYLGGNSCFLFNTDDIENVIFRGFEDERRNNYIEILREVVTAVETKVNK